MINNRSMPHSTIIPVLGYHDVPEAVGWLIRAFGFTERLRSQIIVFNLLTVRATWL
jgi:hypothetical protein